MYLIKCLCNQETLIGFTKPFLNTLLAEVPRMCECECKTQLRAHLSESGVTWSPLVMGAGPGMEEVEMSLVWPRNVRFHGLFILTVFRSEYRVSILSIMSILSMSMSMVLYLLLGLGSSPHR